MNELLQTASNQYERAKAKLKPGSYVLCGLPFLLLCLQCRHFSPLPFTLAAGVAVAAALLDFWKPWYGGALAALLAASCYLETNIIYAGLCAILLLLAAGMAENKSGASRYVVPFYLLILLSGSLWLMAAGVMLLGGLFFRKKSFHAFLLPLSVTARYMTAPMGLPLNTLKSVTPQQETDLVAYFKQFFASSKDGALAPVVNLLKINGKFYIVLLLVCLFGFLAIAGLHKKLKLGNAGLPSLFLLHFAVGAVFFAALAAGLSYAAIKTTALTSQFFPFAAAFLLSLAATVLIDGYAFDVGMVSAGGKSVSGNEMQGRKLKTARNGWASIAGYEATKQEIDEAILPYRDLTARQQMERAGVSLIKGILLFGPPGVGKTMFARAIASESAMNFISVKGSEFTTKYVGESEENLRTIFKRATESAPCVIFFDEIESFLMPRSADAKSWERTLVTTFLAEMDGFSQLKNVLIVGATNDPDQIDSAAIRPGRIDKCIFIDTPNLEGRMAILKLYLEKRTTMNEEEFEKLAQKMERYSAADIRGIAEEAYRQKKFQALTLDDLLSMLPRYKPTMTLEMRDRYQKLVVKYSRSVSAQEDKSIDKRAKHSWDEIAGMEDVRREVRDKVEKPLLYAEKYAELGLEVTKGVLMYGPPGCGKTLFAKVIASEYHCHFITVNGPELLSGFVGESEKKLRQVFQEARENRPTIIFFDEFDAIAENRDQQGQVKLINQLLTEMDGMEDLKGVLVIAATNRLNTIDPALKRPGRFDTILYVGMPDEASREAQFRLHLKKLDVPDLDFSQLASLSEGFTCADIAGCSNKILHKSLDHTLEGAETITEEEIFEIVGAYTPTLSEEEIEEYEQTRVRERR